MVELASMESITGSTEFVEVEFEIPSKLVPEQSPCKTRNCQDVDAEMVGTPVIINGIQSGLEVTRPGCLGGDAGVAHLKEEVTLKQVELQEDMSANVKELEEYFTALEQDIWNLKERLLDQKEEHRMKVCALEREREQERLEWERDWREKEEALLSSMRSMIISRNKLMNDLRSQPHMLVSTKHLAGTAISKKQSSKWWSVKKHQVPGDAAAQDANTGATSKSMKAAESDLQKIKKLEKKVRKAERKKQQKALAKAQKKAEKEEKREGKKKYNKVKDGSVPRWWPRYLFTVGCATHTEDM